MLKPGDRITVFQDYWLGMNPEGEAELIRLIGSDPIDKVDHWLVRFLDDPENQLVSRFIRVDESGDLYWIPRNVERRQT